MKKIKCSRICVTLPVDMMENFKYLSSVTGLSISKLIFNRLRTNKPIVIVPQEFQKQLENLIELLSRIEQAGYVNDDIVQALKNKFLTLVEVNKLCELLKERIKNETTCSKSSNADIGEQYFK